MAAAKNTVPAELAELLSAARDLGLDPKDLLAAQVSKAKAEKAARIAEEQERKLGEDVSEQAKAIKAVVEKFRADNDRDVSVIITADNIVIKGATRGARKNSSSSRPGRSSAAAAEAAAKENNLWDEWQAKQASDNPYKWGLSNWLKRVKKIEF